MLYQGALILEGGGFRGVYTAGVLDFFMEKQAMFASIYGISAGACNALSYLSQDKGRYVAIAKRFCNDPRYVGMRQLLTKGSIFNWQFSFYEIPEKYVPFDYDTFYASPMELRVGATDCESGECHWFSNRQQGDDVIADSIPVRRAYEDGWHKQVVVLTQNEGYVKKPNQMMPLIRRRYRDYPNLCRAMENRHLNYNESQQFAKELERKGQAVVIRPSKPMVLHRIEHNVDKLQAAYENGYEDAKAAWSRIEQLFQQQ